MSASVSRTETLEDERRRPPTNAVPEPQGSRKRLVLPDPIAFKLLREDLCTKVIEPQAVVEGYELYIVEQWACSRTQPTSVIATFTGLPQHKLVAGILSVPSSEDEWSETLKSYLDAVGASHARRKETPQGTLMVTNLSNFPSALTVIPVPEGELKAHRESFVINENLKRLGCSGRAGLTLAPPTSTTTAKFVQQYHIHDSVPITEAVTTLVRLCQAALILFDVLAPVYIDGLLCDMTESAINKWWTKVGTEYYSIEPSDGVLGPTTVSALLGLFMGARNRLNSCGGPTVKDAFDVGAMERSIGYYQRSQKLSGTKPGRLDRQTLDSLHRTTSKAANNERWLVPRAVKSTVAEFGGKGGEMVMGIVGRDKAGIAEIETLDINKFAEVVSGRHSRRLWQGHHKKPDSMDLFSASRDDEQMFSGDETVWDTKAAKRKTAEIGHKIKATATEPFYSSGQHGSQSSLEALEKEALRKNVLRSMTGRMSEARSGIGRFKDAVGRTALRSNHPRGSQQSNTDAIGRRSKDLYRDGSSKQQLPRRPRNSTDRRDDMPSDIDNQPSQTSPVVPTGKSSSKVNIETDKAARHTDTRRESSTQRDPAQPEGLGMGGLAQRPKSDSGTDLDAGLDDWRRNLPDRIRPSRSMEGLVRDTGQPLHKLRESLPRQMSAAAIDVAPSNSGEFQAGEKHDPSDAMVEEQILITQNINLIRRIERLSSDVQPFTKAKLEELEMLGRRLEQERAELEYEYTEKINEHRVLEEGTEDLLQEEEAFLTETLREMEVLGARLEYELSTLVSKVEDVEDGVVDFEHQVQDLEFRLETLGAAEEKSSPWLMRVLGL